MKTPIAVRLVGPALLCQAIEALLSTVSPIYMDDAPPGDDDAPNTNTRRRAATNPAELLVVLLVGEGWQSRVAAEARLPKRNDAAVTPRYALIADGNKVDFYGARKMAINAFVGTDEPVSVLVQAIQAAAHNRLYCSPQLLPALIDAVGGNANDNPGASANGTRNGERCGRLERFASRASFRPRTRSRASRGTRLIQRTDCRVSSVSVFRP